MRTRRETVGLIGGAASMAFASGASARSDVHATAITQVFGDGQKLTAVVLDYGQAIDKTRLTASSFKEEGRIVTRVYANAIPEPAKAPRGDRYVVVELSPADPDAALFVSAGRSFTRRPAKARVTQVADVFAGSGRRFRSGATIETIATRNLVVDSFKAALFADPTTGDRLPYNLFVPKNYDPAKRYPLVLFMHDMGACGAVVDTALVQGLGAVVWADDADQARREAFVLAPQYPAQVVNDASEATSFLDTTVHLVEHLTSRFAIDRDRLYTTGQSMGAMMSMAMNIKYPDLFAASLIVAGQWDPALVKPLAKDKLWIIVSEGDLKAYPGQNAITAVLEGQGAKVARAVWNGASSPEQFAADVAAMRGQGASVNYVALRKGTVVPPGQPDNGGSNHVNTWRIAYAIEGMRDWLFEQRR
ncbi:alpha/beta hydrolase-fold protein [Caulobacter sp. LARHSG274]